MQSISKYVAAVAAGLVSTCGVAIASPIFLVPEPGSIALAVVGLAGALALGRKSK